MMNPTRILFIDDEEAIAKMQKQMLSRSGFCVEIFTSAEDALKSFNDDPAAVDVVITDMTMPEMTGDVLAQKIKNMRSNMPVILCTGYTEKVDVENPQAIGIDVILLKPITRKDLIAAIESVL